MRNSLSQEAIAALVYVYYRFLCHPMSDTDLSRDTYIAADGQHIPYVLNESVDYEEGFVYRVNHGLAHTARVVSLIELVIEYINLNEQQKKKNQQKQTKLFDPHDKQNKSESSPFDSEAEKIRLEIAAAFYVACRESEADVGTNPKRVQEYRKAEADAFAKYAENVMFKGEPLFSSDPKSPCSLLLYQEALLNPYDGHGEKPVKKIKRILMTAHNMDLPRCYSIDQLDVNRFPNAENLRTQTEIRLRLTGNGICSTFDGSKFVDEKVPEKTALFQLCSLHPEITVRLIQLAEYIETTEIADQFSIILQYYAEKGAEIFKDFLLRAEWVLETEEQQERALSSVPGTAKSENKTTEARIKQKLNETLKALIAQELIEKKGGMRFDGAGHYLPEAGPLEKTIYTKTFEMIASRLLQGEPHRITAINGQYFIFFENKSKAPAEKTTEVATEVAPVEKPELFHLNDIIAHTNFQQIILSVDDMTHYQTVIENIIKQDAPLGKIFREKATNFLSTDKSGLTLPETYAVTYYTMGDISTNDDPEKEKERGYGLINRLLRNASDQNPDKIFEAIMHAAVLASALRKLFSVENYSDLQTELTAIRHFRTYEKMPAFHQLKHHNIVSMAGFLSSAKANDDVAGKKITAFGPLRMEFYGARLWGALIASASANPGENEILMPPGQQLQIFSHLLATANNPETISVRIVSDVHTHVTTKPQLILNLNRILPLYELACTEDQNAFKCKMAKQYLQLYGMLRLQRLLTPAVFKEIFNMQSLLRQDNIPEEKIQTKALAFFKMVFSPEFKIPLLISAIESHDMTQLQFCLAQTSLTDKQTMICFEKAMDAKNADAIFLFMKMSTFSEIDFLERPLIQKFFHVITKDQLNHLASEAELLKKLYLPFYAYLMLSDHQGMMNLFSKGIDNIQIFREKLLWYYGDPEKICRGKFSEAIQCIVALLTSPNMKINDLTGFVSGLSGRHNQSIIPSILDCCISKKISMETHVLLYSALISEFVKLYPKVVIIPPVDPPINSIHCFIVLFNKIGEMDNELKRNFLLAFLNENQPDLEDIHTLCVNCNLFPTIPDEKITPHSTETESDIIIGQYIASTLNELNNVILSGFSATFCSWLLALPFLQYSQREMIYDHISFRISQNIEDNTFGWLDYFARSTLSTDKDYLSFFLTNQLPILTNDKRAAFLNYVINMPQNVVKENFEALGSVITHSQITFLVLQLFDKKDIDADKKEAVIHTLLGFIQQADDREVTKSSTAPATMSGNTPSAETANHSSFFQAVPAEILAVRDSKEATPTLALFCIRDAYLQLKKTNTEEETIPDPCLTALNNCIAEIIKKYNRCFFSAAIIMDEIESLLQKFPNEKNHPLIRAINALQEKTKEIIQLLKGSADEVKAKTTGNVLKLELDAADMIGLMNLILKPLLSASPTTSP